MLKTTVEVLGYIGPTLLLLAVIAAAISLLKPWRPRRSQRESVRYNQMFPKKPRQF